MDLAEAAARGFAHRPRHPWERARLALTRHLLRRHVPLADGDVVVDIGCGDTFVIESLALQYSRARFFAVDSAFTPELIATLTGRLSARNVTLFPSLRDVPRDRPASLILLMDVLEHVRDDRGMLQALVRDRVVSPRTRFLITVPAYPVLFCSHDRFLGHHRRYSRAAFDRLVADAALVPLAAGGFFATLLPVRLARALVEGVVGGRRHAASELAAWRGGEAIGRTLACLLECDGRISLALLGIGIRVPGLSHFAICRTSA